MEVILSDFKSRQVSIRQLSFQRSLKWPLLPKAHTVEGVPYEVTETTIFEGSKNSEIQILGCFLLYFHQNRTRERATSRISANFFSRILERFGASEKNGVGFRKNLFHAYFSCKSAIARDRDFEVKTAFYEVLRANYSNGRELWLQTFFTTQKYGKNPFQRCAQI